MGLVRRSGRHRGRCRGRCCRPFYLDGSDSAGVVPADGDGVGCQLGAQLNLLHLPQGLGLHLVGASVFFSGLGLFSIFILVIFLAGWLGLGERLRLRAATYNGGAAVLLGEGALSRLSHGGLFVVMVALVILGLALFLVLAVALIGVVSVTLLVIPGLALVSVVGLVLLVGHHLVWLPGLVPPLLPQVCGHPPGCH